MKFSRIRIVLGNYGKILFCLLILHLEFSGSAGGWCKKNSDRTPWIQVDFESKVHITALITQGRDLGETPVYNWVMTFTVEFSDNGLEWSAVMTAGAVPLEVSLTIVPQDT